MINLLVAGITDGDLFIFALTRPEPESVDHAVDSGDAAFSFALPQPSVTHVPFVTPATTDHAVNAGDAAFAFALPEPTVTHTLSQRSLSQDFNREQFARYLPRHRRLERRGFGQHHALVCQIDHGDVAVALRGG